MPQSNIIKIFQTIQELWNAQEFGSEIRSGEINKKEQSKSCPFCMQHFYLLIYVPTECYPDI